MCLRNTGWDLRILNMLTRSGSIVGYKSSQIQLLVVDVEVLQTADELPAAEGEVIGSVGNSTQKQRASQIQRPEK